mgnify:CR=1 FL=1
MADQIVRYMIEGTIISLKGTCNAGHKVGDKFLLNRHKTAGLCGVFYHALFPWILSLEHGGTFPTRDPDVMEFDCPDSGNAARIRLRRIR